MGNSVIRSARYLWLPERNDTLHQCAWFWSELLGWPLLQWFLSCLNILFKAVRWALLGLALNLVTALTAWAMSGRVPKATQKKLLAMGSVKFLGLTIPLARHAVCTTLLVDGINSSMPYLTGGLRSLSDLRQGC